jgi:TFIIF-interacting CTD phosphatase-like protein
MLAFPIVDALDQQGVIHYRLFRDSTKYENGIHRKDLDKLNRDLSKVKNYNMNIVNIRQLINITGNHCGLQ